MSTAKDSYADWDAAYLLGALSPLERRDFEEHLADCDSCSAAVAELAGVPGLLARVPRGQAEALLDEHDSRPQEPAQSRETLPALLAAARAQNRRSRRWRISATLAAAAAAAVLALVIPHLLVSPAEPQGGPEVTMSQVVPTALSADIRLVSEPWGTRIESTCRYLDSEPDNAPYSAAGTNTYALVVTDRSGNATEVSTWRAWPGLTVEPTATTHLTVASIASVEIRSASTGQTLLRSTFG